MLRDASQWRMDWSPRELLPVNISIHRHGRRPWVNVSERLRMYTPASATVPLILSKYCTFQQFQLKFFPLLFLTSRILKFWAYTDPCFKLLIILLTLCSALTKQKFDLLGLNAASRWGRITDHFKWQPVLAQDLKASLRKQKRQENTIE